MVVCPIGLTQCQDDSTCPNYYACKDWTLSWSLPLEIEEGCIRVSQQPRRFYWKKIFTEYRVDGIRVKSCPLPFGDYSEIAEGTFSAYDEHGGWFEYDEPSPRDEILKAWAQAGYAPAVPSKVSFPPAEQDESNATT